MTLHTKLSYVKSVLRLVGYGFLIRAAYCPGWECATGFLWLAGVVLVGSELIGIAEEAWPGAYEGTETETK